jgi:hypothetical protein
VKRLDDIVQRGPIAPPLSGWTTAPTAAPADYCGCIKPPECWGNCGIHFRFFGERDVERELQRALRSLPAGSGDASRAQVERTTRQWCQLYVGRHVAYEQCPAYRVAVAEEITRQRDQQSRARRGFMGLVGDDD